MNDVNQVVVRGDQGTESIGKSKYFASGDFRKREFHSSVLVMVSLVILIFLAMFFTQKDALTEKSGQGLATPGISMSNAGINPKLLTSKDLVNLIQRPQIDSSALGKIKIVSLRTVSELPIGSEMKAKLESGATNGIVMARLTVPLIVDSELVLPEKTILFGKGQSGEERLYVEFSKVIFPNGESFSIRAQAFDLSDKILGLKGAFVGIRTKKMAGAIGFGILGGMADSLQDTSGSFFMNKRPSTRDAALAGASKAALDQSQAYIDEMKKSPNIIEVKAGTEFIAITDEPDPKKKDAYEK